MTARDEKTAVRADWASIGQRIGEAIDRSGKSRRQVAMATGIDPGALSKAILGKRGLSPAQVSEIARLLETDPAVLQFGATAGRASAQSTGLPAAEAIAAYLERHPLDLTPREKTILEGLRNRLGSTARVTEADVAQLLRIVREVFLSGDS